MIRLGIYSLAVGFGLAFNTSVHSAESQPGPTPEFREVYDLVREHLAGVNEADLNRAAVEGLLSVLGPKVTLLAGNTNDAASAQARLTSRSAIFDSGIAYVRIVRIAEGLDKAVRDAVTQLSGTNELNGVILDLRFTGGDDYGAAAATADLFLKKERPLLDWGQGVVQSKEKADALSFPVAVLVNHQTTGAAEALAAVLREAGTSLILGNKTAGQAVIAQEYALTNGDRLRIASSPVHLGDGSTISSEGLKPDITVAVSPLAEQSYYADAYKEVIKTNTGAGAGLLVTNAAAATNRTRRPRFNEAELVRERKLGITLDSDLDSAPGEAERPMVQDPVLARALDVLKGLSVVRQSHS